MRLKSALSVVVSLMLIAALAACKDTATNGASGGDGSNSYLTLSGQSPFTNNFNPFSTTNMTGTTAIYETLFFANSQRKANAPLQPVLATKYSISKDKKKLTLTTRSGVKWNDGKAFGPADVAFTFNYVQKHPEINSQGVSGSAKVTGADKVTISYKHPGVVSALTSLTKQWIVPEHVWKSVKSPATASNAKAVGTGPFKPGTFSSQTYTLVKNPSYWDTGKPHIAGIRMISSKDNDTTSDLLMSGKVSWSGVTPPTKNYFDANKDLKNTTVITGQLSYAACSNPSLGCKGPQTDPAVRQAIYYAINRNQLNKLAFSSTASDISPTFVLLPRDKQWISSSISNPTAAVGSGAQTGKAEEILKKAGYTKGKDGIFQKDGKRVSMTVEAVQGFTDWQNAVDTSVQQLKSAGIELKTHYVSSSAWGTDANTGDFQLLIWNLTPNNLVEPYGTYNSFFSSSSTAKVGDSAPGSNYARYENSTVDKAIKVLANTQDDSTRAKEYDVIQRQIVKDMPYIPVIGYSNYVQFDVARFGNWPTDDNPYAGQFSWMQPDFEIVLKNVTTKE